MALEKGGITAMTIVPLGALAVKTSPLLIRSYISELQDACVVNGSGEIIDLDRLQVFALDYLKMQPFELAGYKAMPEDVQKLYDLSVKYAL